MDIERRLRESLAARPAPPDFESAVMARLRETAPPEGSVEASPPAPAAAVVRRRGRRWQMPAALAATVLATAVGLHWHAEQRRAEQGREQLMLALAITSSQLNQVQQRLSRPVATDSQENGS